MLYNIFSLANCRNPEIRSKKMVYVKTNQAIHVLFLYIVLHFWKIELTLHSNSKGVSDTRPAGATRSVHAPEFHLIIYLSEFSSVFTPGSRHSFYLRCCMAPRLRPQTAPDCQTKKITALSTMYNYSELSEKTTEQLRSIAAEMGMKRPSLPTATTLSTTSLTNRQ